MSVPKCLLRCLIFAGTIVVGHATGVDEVCTLGSDEACALGAAMLQHRTVTARAAQILEPEAAPDAAPEAPRLGVTRVDESTAKESFTEAVYAESKFAADGQAAVVSLLHRGETFEFAVEPMNIYSRTGAVKVHGKDGLQSPLPSRLFKSKDDKLVLAELHTDGSVSGMFPVGSRVLRVRPRSTVQLSLLSADAATESTSSHVAEVLTGYGIHTAGNEPEGEGNRTSDDEVNSDAVDPTDGGSLPEEVPWNGTAFYPGCFMGDEEMYIMEIRVSADVMAYQIWGDEVQFGIELAIAEVSYVLENQFHIALKIKEFDIYQDDAVAPDWANSTCVTTPTDATKFMYEKLDQLTDAKAGAGFGDFQAFTGCGNGWGVIGLAWVSQLCGTSGHNSAINQLHSAVPWHVVLHELGHNLGEGHTPCGMNESGGVMGWCDSNGYWGGAFGFNKYLSYENMCGLIMSKQPTCEEYFYPAHPSPSVAVTGLQAEFFFGMEGLPGYHSTPNMSRVDSVVNYTAVEDFPYASTMAARWTGGININQTGTYTFSVEAAFGQLYIDGSFIAADEPGLVVLSAGLHSLILLYSGIPDEVVLRYGGPDTLGVTEVIPDLALQPAAHGFSAQFYYDVPGCNIPYLTSMEPDVTQVDETLFYTSTSDPWEGLTKADNYAARWIGSLFIMTGGEYSFQITSDDGSKLYVDDVVRPLVDNDGCHGMQGSAGMAVLAPGLHLIVVDYIESGGGAGMELRYKGKDTHDRYVTPHPTRLLATGIVSTTTTTTTTTTTNATANPGLEPGLFVEFYSGSFTYNMPNFSALVPFDNRVDASISYSATGGKWTGLDLHDNYAARWTGFLKIKSGGTYTFQTTSDDGSMLYINGTEIVNNDGPHGMVTKTGQLYMDAGLYSVVVEYYEWGGGAGMIWEYSGPDTGSQVVVVPESVLLHAPTPVTGLIAEFFEVDACASTSKMPDLEGLTPWYTRTDKQVNYPSSFPGLGRSDNFAVRWTGGLRIRTAGTYKLQTTSDDGSLVYINGAQLVNNDGAHGMRRRSGTAHLEAGLHEIRVEFFECGGGQGIFWEYSGPDTGDNMILVPTDVLEPYAPAGPTQGLFVEFFALDVCTSQMPDFDIQEPFLSRIDAVVDYGWGYTTRGVDRNDMFGARWTGHLHIETEGTYTFFMNSDDGSLLYLNQTLVVNNVPGNTIKSGNRYMYAGAYEVVLEYYECGGAQCMIWQYSGADTGYSTMTVPPSVLTPPAHVI